MDVDSALYAASQRTPAGGVSRPVAINGEWHLVKVLELRQQQSLVQARGAIVSELVRAYRHAAIQAALDSLKTRMGVTVATKLPPFFLPPVGDRVLR